MKDNIIRTVRKSARNGSGNILATCNGRQKTTKWDHSKSTAWNHGTAAANLILHAGRFLPPLRLDVTTWEHDNSDDGNRHGFAVLG